MEDIFNTYKEKKVKDKIEQLQLNVDETLKPVVYSTVDLVKTEEVAGLLLGQILPFILITGVLLGSIYPAIDSMAGEKERGTLETLFTLPISNLCHSNGHTKCSIYINDTYIYIINRKYKWSIIFK